MATKRISQHVATVEEIERTIHVIRGQRVMLDVALFVEMPLAAGAGELFGALSAAGGAIEAAGGQAGAPLS